MEVECVDNRIGLNFSTIRFDDDFACSLTSISFNDRATTNLSLTMPLDLSLEIEAKLHKINAVEVAKLNEKNSDHAEIATEVAKVIDDLSKVN